LTCRLVGYDPFVDAAGMAEHGVRKVETVDDVIDAADYITVHVPLLDSTRPVQHRAVRA